MKVLLVNPMEESHQTGIFYTVDVGHFDNPKEYY